MSLITKEGYDFSFDPSICKSCGGACCIGESGYAWINDEEIEKLAQLLKISVQEVIESYLTKVHHRYTINEYSIGDDKYACVFFDMDRRKCTVYEARPTQCRTFPFWEDYIIYKDGSFYECPATSPLSQS